MRPLNAVAADEATRLAGFRSSLAASVTKMGTGAAPRRGHVIALLPSWGVGGGIEAYCAAVLESLKALEVPTTTVALRRRRGGLGLLRKPYFTVKACVAAWRLRREVTTILVCHSGLTAVGILTGIFGAASRGSIKVLFYGKDVWTISTPLQWLIRISGVGLVTISNFSAAGLLGLGLSTVLRPGIPRATFDAYTAIGRDRGSRSSPGIRIISTFRLIDAESKGAYVLIEAVERVRTRLPDTPIRLVIAGSGPAPQSLRERVTSLPWVELVPSPRLDELAKLYESSDVFVLATQPVAPGRKTGFVGEGFGLVLVEAQLAGLPVVAPRIGGSADAFLPGLTGTMALDHTPEALETVLTQLVQSAHIRERLGANAYEWARLEFNPNEYMLQVGRALGLRVEGRTALARRPPLVITQ